MTSLKAGQRVGRAGITEKPLPAELLPRTKASPGFLFFFFYGGTLGTFLLSRTERQLLWCWLGQLGREHALDDAVAPAAGRHTS